MRIIIKLLPIILLFQSIDCFTQNSIVKKAHKNYKKYEYAEAIRNYEKALEKGYRASEVYKKLGDSYYFNAALEDAASWYEVFMNTSEEIAPIYYFRAAHSFKFIGKYEKAHRLMNKLAINYKENPYAKRFTDNSKYLSDIERQNGRYKIRNLSINSKNSDFAPSFYKNGLVFSSSREVKVPIDELNSWTETPFFKIYFSKVKENGEITSVKKFSRDLDFKFHESTTAFSKYGTDVYFTATNKLNAKSKKDSTYVHGLKIYRAFLGYKNQWIDLVELPFNSDQYSTAHPALSPDNKKLYFASDMPGGYGMSDIYVVDILEDGTFGEPRNLGPEVNTEGRDTFPFVSKNGMLYFSSDGHLGLGGLDIFVTNLSDQKKEIYNLGEPINSAADDMTFIINDTTKKGYFSSNRRGGKGSDDIYGLEELKPIVLDCVGAINVEVVDEITGKGIEGVFVTVENSNKKSENTGLTDINGMYLLSLDCSKKEILLSAKKENYSVQEKTIGIDDRDSVISASLRLRNLMPPSKGTDLATMLAIKPIYFNTAKASITDKAARELDVIVDYLKKYPSVKIEIRSHTDSRGKDNFNLWLSNERAKSTANYLALHGIAVSRIKSKGYGEKELKNKCKNGVKCSAEKHLENRRSEFVVVDN